jgi:hypothetical protein
MLASASRFKALGLKVMLGALGEEIIFEQVGT